jgi:putative hydrolase of the HAD superfamily
MSQPIKAITFDFWSTLYQSQPVNKVARIKKLKASLEELTQTELDIATLTTAVQETWAQWNHIWHHEQRTLMSAEWVDILTHKITLPLSPLAHAKVTEAMELAVLDYPPSVAVGAREMLAELAQEYRLAIISDTGVTPGRILRHILTETDLIGYFHHLTFSDEIGVSKPHALAFHSTLQALNALPHEAVHVGDLLRTDIAGAKAVGMRAVQYVGILPDDHTPTHPITPDAVIEHHDQFRPLLAQWNRS